LDTETHLATPRLRDCGCCCCLVAAVLVGVMLRSMIRSYPPLRAVTRLGVSSTSRATMGTGGTGPSSSCTFTSPISPILGSYRGHLSSSTHHRGAQRLSWHPAFQLRRGLRSPEPVCSRRNIVLQYLAVLKKHSSALCLATGSPLQHASRALRLAAGWAVAAACALSHC
jgi:hypothetical protein